MNRLQLTYIAIIIGLLSCNDDRVAPNVYSSLNEFYELNREEEQSVTIRTDSGEVPIVGKKGTELYGTRQILEYPNGDSVGIPWTVKLIELYTIKDYILYQLPTVGNSTPLESGGIVKVTAYDSVGIELRVKNGAFYQVKLSTSSTKTGMNIFQGNSETGSFINWTPTTDASTLSIDANSKYDLQLATLGWQHVAQASYPATTNVTFTVNGSGGEFIDIWMIPSTKHALFYGTNLSATNIPLGEPMRIIAMAINQDKDFVLFDKTIDITENLSIEIVFEKSSEEAILNLLETL